MIELKGGKSLPGQCFYVNISSVLLPALVLFVDLNVLFLFVEESAETSTEGEQT